jgi:hypothetical protein
MFDFYIEFDPSLWWNNKQLIKTAKQHFTQFPATEKRLWFAGSNAKDISRTVGKLAALLKEENPQNLQWWYSDKPNEKHNTIFRATEENAIIWSLNT